MHMYMLIVVHGHVHVHVHVHSHVHVHAHAHVMWTTYGRMCNFLHAACLSYTIAFRQGQKRL
jgi:hypothetical protein